jgi:hypothetical protein
LHASGRSKPSRGNKSKRALLSVLFAFLPEPDRRGNQLRCRTGGIPSCKRRRIRIRPTEILQCTCTSNFTSARAHTDSLSNQNFQ